MRVLVVTWGSRGDVLPYLALAVAFARRGHVVQLGAPDNAEFAAAAAEQGIPFFPLGPPLTRPALLQLGKSATDDIHGAELAFDALLLSHLESIYDTCRELARSVDVIVAHCIQPAGRMAADALGLPFVSGAIIPAYVPSRCRPPQGAPNLGRWANWLLWRILTRRADRFWAEGINRARARVGLPTLRGSVLDILYSPDLNLVATSPHVIPAPPDWAPRHQVTGYWFLEHPDWTPPPDVAEFVEREPRAIAMSLGIMLGWDVGELVELVLDALQTSGVRAVLDPGWTDLGARSLPSTALCRFVPHSWLLPRVAALVHHGGTGTMAAAYRAGTPSVLVPQITDHRLTAMTAIQLGVATPPIPPARLTAEHLAQAITTATTDIRLRGNAVRLAAAIQQEHGTGVAVSLVEDFVRHSAAHQYSKTKDTPG